MPAYLYRVNRWVEHFLNAKGNVTVADVEPSMRVSTIFATGVEDRLYQGFNRYYASTVTAAVAAQTSGWQFRNPVGSNVVAVLERLFVKLNHTISTNSNVNFSRDATAPADLTGGTQRGVNLDIRAGGILSTAVTSQANTVASLNNVTFSVDVSGGPNQGFDLVATVNQEIAVAPGDTWRIVDSTVNEIMLISVLWRERALETSELTA